MVRPCCAVQTVITSSQVGKNSSCKSPTCNSESETMPELAYFSSSKSVTATLQTTTIFDYCVRRFNHIPTLLVSKHVF